jgi:hypothetical protein
MLRAEDVRNHISTLAQATTLAAIAIYIFGFMVLSVQHASFGLPQINLLRPKIVSAGLLLCVFAAIPIWETLKIVEVQQFAAITPNTPERFKAGLKMLPWLLMAMTVSAFICRQLLVGSWFSPGTHEYWLVLGLLPLPAVAVASQVWPWSLPLRIVALTLATAWLVFGAFRTRDKTFYVLIGWFSWCAFVTLKSYGHLVNIERLRTMSLFQAVMAVSSTFVIFGLFVYGQIPAMLGGGEAVPATISFVMQDKQPPVGNTQQLKVWMVDETDAGFYFLVKKDAKNAIVVPRNGVSAIYFGE